MSVQIFKCRVLEVYQKTMHYIQDNIIIKVSFVAKNSSTLWTL